jgi:ParB family chromosome partitioning protein
MHKANASKDRSKPAAIDAKPRRLGRGLSGLIGIEVPVSVAAPVTDAAPANNIILHTEDNVTSMGVTVPGPIIATITMVSVDAIVPSPFQPRRVIDETALAQLADSIKHAGVMQPIIVRARPDGVYELVVGERRWRAARRAGLDEVPALVRALEDADAAEWALVENVQREDLNAMERAWALRSLAERFNLTHAELAERVALDRSSVANLIRLTDLEPEIAELIAQGSLNAGHGKALLSVPAGSLRVTLAQEAARSTWSVRRLEAESQAQARAAKARVPGTIASDESVPRSAVLRDLERQIGQQLGTKVAILADRKGTKGRVQIEFYGLDHFEGLLARMNIKTT